MKKTDRKNVKVKMTAREFEVLRDICCALGTGGYPIKSLGNAFEDVENVGEARVVAQTFFELA